MDRFLYDGGLRHERVKRQINDYDENLKQLFQVVFIISVWYSRRVIVAMIMIKLSESHNHGYERVFNQTFLAL